MLYRYWDNPRTGHVYQVSSAILATVPCEATDNLTAAMGVDIEAAKAARDQTDGVQREQRDFRRMYQASRHDEIFLFSSFIYTYFCRCFFKRDFPFHGRSMAIYLLFLIDSY